MTWIVRYRKTGDERVPARPNLGMEYGDPHTVQAETKIDVYEKCGTADFSSGLRAMRPGDLMISPDGTPYILTHEGLFAVVRPLP